MTTTPARFRLVALERLVEINGRCRMAAYALRRQGGGWDVDPGAAERWWNEGGARETLAQTHDGTPAPDYYEDPDAYTAFVKKREAAYRAASRKANAKREFTPADWEAFAARMRVIAQEAVALAQYAETAARQITREASR